MLDALIWHCLRTKKFGFCNSPKCASKSKVFESQNLKVKIKSNMIPRKEKLSQGKRNIKPQELECRSVWCVEFHYCQCTHPSIYSLCMLVNAKISSLSNKNNNKTECINDTVLREDLRIFVAFGASFCCGSKRTSNSPSKLFT